MEETHSIDIIIPSFRLDEKTLLHIINLEKPKDFKISIYIIADNPVALIPSAIKKLHETGAINLIINNKNKGVSETRNIGIRTGTGKWALLLDDDIKPQDDLLLAYAEGIKQHENAMGLVGVTYFPEPFNAVTKAMDINGSVGHFKAAKHHSNLIWAPTANMMLNKQKMDVNLFDPALIKSGEDIDFLVRNCLLFNERYQALPAAVVHHPWWNNGSVQTARMFRYGEGSGEIARKQPVKNYSYRDFTNTSENILLLLLMVPFAWFYGWMRILVSILIALIVSEFITNWLKAIKLGKIWSPAVAFHLMWAKNCHEFGFLYSSLCSGSLNGFALRLELGFARPHPSPFRLNRWKIIKSILLILLSALLIIYVSHN